MNQPLFLRIIGILALGVAQAVFAQAPVQQSDAEIPLGLSQKQVFARSLIEDASVAKRIQESQDVEAQRLLTLAGDSYNAALAALKGGDFASAEKQLNESMSAIAKARRRVPDVAALAAKQRADYQKMLESIESLQKSYLSYLKRAKPLPAPSDNETDARASLGIARLVDAAKMHAQEGRMGDALQALEKAEQVMKSALGRVLGSTMLEYTQKFASLAEEYAFELERNRSYLDLIPVAIDELKPTEDAKQTIESLVEQDRAAIDLAREYEKLRDYAKAVAHVRAGTSYLQLALGAAGLVLSKGPRAE